MAGADRFSAFAAIDWSGAAGELQRGIAIAICTPGTDAPRLLHAARGWSRPQVLDWLARDMPADTLVGCDLGTSLPFRDCGAFFPGWGESPADARGLWALVDRLCADDAHLGCAAFVDHPEAARHFRRHGGREGDLFGGGAGRFRATEQAQRAQGCKPYSNFNLVGAAQVGKSSLTGMRMLNRLRGRLAVWPFDSLPQAGSVLVEIYTAIAAMAAGRSASRSKMRDRTELNRALAALGSEPYRARTALDDHKADALVTAAWLRRAGESAELWRPAGLDREIAMTEGWTFGVV